MPARADRKWWSLIRELPNVGKVLFCHGDTMDSLHGSALGRLGDAVSRRFGGFTLVRDAAHLAERFATKLAGEEIIQTFGSRGRELAAREGCALAVFGHIHRQHLIVGDSYANAGHLSGERLEYLCFEEWGPRCGAFTLGDVE